MCDPLYPTGTLLQRPTQKSGLAPNWLSPASDLHSTSMASTIYGETCQIVGRSLGRRSLFRLCNRIAGPVGSMPVHPTLFFPDRRGGPPLMCVPRQNHRLGHLTRGQPESVRLLKSDSMPRVSVHNRQGSRGACYPSKIALVGNQNPVQASRRNSKQRPMLSFARELPRPMY